MGFRALLFFSLCLASVASAARRRDFPRDPPYVEDEYDADAAMEDRARHATEACRHFAEYNSPEYESYKFEVKSVPPAGEAEYVGKTVPPFQYCSPPFTWPEFWSDFSRAVDAARLDKKRKKPLPDPKEDPEAYKRLINGRKKVVAVANPLLRLARAYLEVVKDSSSLSTSSKKHLDTIKKVFGEGSDRLTFKNFVHSLTKAGEVLSSLAPGSEKEKDLRAALTDQEFNRPWSPYRVSCPICHPDNYPSYVLKSDSPSTEADLEHVREVFDLEDVEGIPEGPKETVSDTTLKALFSQLDRKDLDDLVEFFHVDFFVYRYSPEKFYQMLK